MKTLLAIINEPKESKGFIRYVAQMATNLKVNVHVLYAYSRVEYPLNVTANNMGQASLEIHKTMEEFLENSKTILQRYMNELSAEVSNNVFTGITVEIGGTEVSAEKVINDKNIEMAVIESRAEASFWSQTSSNMDLIRELKCPVWIIPKGDVYRPIKNIVYATDYNEEDVSNLSKLIHLFPHLMPNITALHITDSGDFNNRIKKAGFKEMIQEKLPYANLIVKAIHRENDDDVAQLLADFAETNQTDLAVVLKQNKSFFARLFKENHTKEILEKSEIPVLVFHETK
ncbi:Universal stress protein family protein [Saccharicrinis carchari]|uniref:Universal stress protein family protein n=1 Tax=Saccharicrinis carchari TaxID=1168039 RepID=A0A521BEB8_SACCC|nr:universal stress protein [Saccharicrinis carchari]SMO45455.1 Universal stress protein family protein [Saccharicrinis carchari]